MTAKRGWLSFCIWLALAHQKLDAAVFAAYGLDMGMSDDELLAALLALNLEKAGKEEVYLVLRTPTSRGCYHAPACR